jgi:hypothetical protein
MNKQEAGRLGAISTKRNFGLTTCPTCGAIKQSGFYAQNGTIGGEKTFKLYGREWMSRIGKLGGRPKDETT